MQKQLPLFSEKHMESIRRTLQVSNEELAERNRVPENASFNIYTYLKTKHLRKKSFSAFSIE